MSIFLVFALWNNHRFGYLLCATAHATHTHIHTHSIYLCFSRTHSRLLTCATYSSPTQTTIIFEYTHICGALGTFHGTHLYAYFRLPLRCCRCVSSMSWSVVRILALSLLGKCTYTHVATVLVLNGLWLFRSANTAHTAHTHTRTQSDWCFICVG